MPTEVHCVSPFSSFHDSSEQLQLLKEYHHSKRKWFDFQQQNNAPVPVENDSKKPRLEEYSKSEPEQKPKLKPLIIKFSLPQLQLALANSKGEKSKVDSTETPIPKKEDNIVKEEKLQETEQNSNVKELSKELPWTLPLEYQPFPLSVTLPFIKACATSGSCPPVVSFAAPPSSGLPFHMFPATLSFPTLLSMVGFHPIPFPQVETTSSPNINGKLEQKDLEESGEEEFTSDGNSSSVTSPRVYNTRSRKQSIDIVETEPKTERPKLLAALVSIASDAFISLKDGIEFNFE